MVAPRQQASVEVAPRSSHDAITNAVKNIRGGDREFEDLPCCNTFNAE